MTHTPDRPENAIGPDVSRAVTTPISSRAVSANSHVVEARRLLEQQMEGATANRSARRKELIAAVVDRIGNGSLRMMAVTEPYGIRAPEDHHLDDDQEKQAQGIVDSIAAHLIRAAGELHTAANDAFVTTALARGRFPTTVGPRDNGRY